MKPALRMPEEMTRSTLDYQTLYCTGTVWTTPLRSRPGLTCRVRACFARGPGELHQETGGVYTVDMVSSVFDSLKFSMNLC